MKRALVALLAGCFAMGFASVAMAGFDNDPASISLHIGPWFGGKVCANQPALDRTLISTQTCGVENDRYNVWVLVCNGSDSLGIAGMEFGIDYDGDGSSGVDVFGWTMCADLQFPSNAATPPIWPAAGSGNVITWNPGPNCQNTNSEPYVPGSVIAIGGVLDIAYYSPDALAITPRYTSVQQRAKVADCAASETDITTRAPSQLGIAEFCAGPGYNPCFQPTPNEETSWGRIKEGYRN